MKVRCPACGKALKVKGQFTGKKGKCRHCGYVLEIPRESPIHQPAAPHPKAPVVRTAREQRIRMLAIVIAVLVALAVAAYLLGEGGRKPAPAPVPGAIVSTPLQHIVRIA